jgi:nitrite reductase (NADH) small subunit
MSRVAEESRRDEAEGWARACALEEIVPDTGVCCLIGRKQVAVFRLGQSERVFALGNYDPFSKANVLSRGIVGDRLGCPKVASPIYKQSFNLETGECLDDPSVSVPAYETRVCDGIVEIREPITRALRAGNSSLLSETKRV